MMGVVFAIIPIPLSMLCEFAPDGNMFLIGCERRFFVKTTKVVVIVDFFPSHALENIKPFLFQFNLPQSLKAHLFQFVDYAL